MKKDIYELTNPQKNIWLTEQFYLGTNINNVVGYLKIEKNANYLALEKAFNVFVQKNDSFKTKLVLENSIPYQYFDEFQYQNIEILDLKDDTQLSEFENEFPKQVINLFDHFLFLTKILRFPDGSGILVLSTHHLISDAWTMSLCLEEIYKNYMNIVDDVAIDLLPSPSYIDFITSQNEYRNSKKFSNDQIFWKNEFSTLPDIISYKNGVHTSIHSTRKVYEFGRDISNQITTFCKKNNLSDYIFLLSIFSIYFKNIFNSNRFVVGNPILNRSNYKEKLMTGMFVSVMPFIVNVTNSSFLEFCHSISNEQRKLYRHIKYPFHEIMNYIKETHSFSDSLFDIVFSYQNTPIPSYSKWLSNHSQSESLQIHIKNVTNTDSLLSIHYDYLIDIFSESDIDLMHQRILHIIEQVLDSEHVLVADIETISKYEKSLLLEDFNDTFVEYNGHSTISKEFESIVSKYPNSIAVIDKNTSLTYEELNNKANFLANKILNSGITTDIIAFSLNRSCDIVVTILAILKSGHTYMPIDPEYPIDRINFMLQNSQTNLLITTNNFYQKTNYSGSCIFYDDLDFNGNFQNLTLEIPYDKKAYIMYTSGSTGIPKAVAIKHYNVLNFVNSMQQRLNYTPSDDNIVLSVTTVCFDIFVFELFPTLLSGLTLVIADELESRSPKLLSSMIDKYKISKLLTTPSRVELLFSDHSYLTSLSSIKEFILGGEPLPKLLLNHLRQHTNSHLYNLYGPTETTVYSCFKDMTNSDFITIGKPIDNTKIYILNDHHKLQPIGLVGEICISGDGVGDGYYHNEQKTSEVFVKNPYEDNILYKTGDLGYWKSNGEIVCLGRKDHQIKIRGYRVELDDISNNILSFPNIHKCVVIDRDDENGKKYLCAYVVSDQDIDFSALKKYLVDILPHYMIPTYYLQIDTIPLTLNHKIDRKSLPVPNLNDNNLLEEYVEPSTEVEKNLCSLFKETLSLTKIGINDDFFDYHLDSLDIIKIQTKMLDYNYVVNTQDFYKYRTIKKLSDLIENKQTESAKVIDVDYLENVNNSFHKHGNDLHFSKHSYRNILLTGSTGYLGIHILEELLTTTDSHITCIVRKKNDENSVNRLRELYSFYFNKDLDLTRITIISSSITLPKLGLSDKTYTELSNSIDFVINSAANVRYYGDYSEFKKINVDLVSNLMDFCLANDIPLAHISTLGVSGNYLVNHEKNCNAFDENDFYIGQKFDENVYIQTKFEAEKLIYEKISEGLKVSIFRVGNLTGRYTDGAFQQNFEDNAFYNILLLILKYQILPTTVMTEFLEFTPVDCCAKAISTFIHHADINHYVFHIFNNHYISLPDLLTIFNDLSFKTELLSGNEFKQQILSLSNQYSEENILKGIVNDLDDSKGLTFNSSVNQRNDYTNSYLEHLNFHWPKVDFSYLEKVVDYLQNKKYI